MSIKITSLGRLKHGGNLADAKHRYPQQVNWLDMSTGISPWSWPLPTIPDELWRALPHSTLALITEAAKQFEVDARHIVVTPGSQLAIRLIPHLFEPCRVAVPSLGYQEHVHSWQLAGHNVVHYDSLENLNALILHHQVDHIVVINPNNPTAETLAPDRLTTLSNRLKETCGGYVLIDEAFSDCSPSSRIKTLPSNTIVFRSFGKFYGLAGLRIGFVLSNNVIIGSLNAILEPWSVSGPSLYIAEQALADHNWQRQQALRIQQQAGLFTPALLALAKVYGITTLKSCGLFHTLFGTQKNIDKLHKDLAQIGVWTRLYNHTDAHYWLRFSLPGDIDEFIQRTQQLVYKSGLLVE